jgi:hypothetical protein
VEEEEEEEEDEVNGKKINWDILFSQLPKSVLKELLHT